MHIRVHIFAETREYMHRGEEDANIGLELAHRHVRHLRRESETSSAQRGWASGFGLQGLSFRVWASGFGLQFLGFSFWASRLQASGFRVSGLLSI